MSKLTKILGCDNPARTVDVVFVHGLDGDAISTWHPDREPDRFWPKWIGEDVPQVGVWSLGYAVAGSAWKGTTMPLIDRATNVLDRLETLEIGKLPIVFVCHSLGGLLVKEMLHQSRAPGNKCFERIAENTRGIVFLSTPHSGANIANWIKHIGTLLRPTVSTQELEAHAPQLRALNTWYRNYACAPQAKIATVVYCERKPLLGILVVDETSADPGIPGVPAVPVDEDHRSISKPKDRQSQIYERVLKLVRSVTANPL